METVDRGQASAGKRTFFTWAIITFGLQALAICLLAFSWGRDLILDSAWVHLLGLAVGILGTSRGSVPVRYLLVFFLTVGVVQNILFLISLEPISNITLIMIVDALLVGTMLTSSFTAAYVLGSKKFYAWFQIQQARHFGTRIRVANGNTPAQGNGSKSHDAEDLPEVGKDELGIFEED